MSTNKRKFEAVTPVKGVSARSASLSSRGSYRTRPESEEDEADESPEVISKKPKLFSTPSRTGRGKKKQTHANTEVNEIDVISHPESPEPTPSKTPRGRGGKTPRTVKKTAPNVTIVSRPNDLGGTPSVSQTIASTPSKSQKRTVSPSKRAAKAIDLDATPRADATKSAALFSDLADNPFAGVSLPGASSNSSPLKPAIPGAARGRKKVPTRQLVRGDSASSAAQSDSASAGSSVVNTDEEEVVPISSRAFANLKTGTTPKKASTSRKLHASPNKKTLANGDVYVDYMVPMPGADDETRQHRGISSGDEGAYISSSAEESEEPRSPIKGRNLFGRTDSYSLASRKPPSASRSSSVSRPPSLSNYDTSSPYTSRGPSPSPSFPHSQLPSETETEESDDDSIYDHQHHVDPTRHLDKLASLARMALVSAEDMRKKGIMREDEAPLPKCFLAGVIVERGKSRAKAPQSPSKRDKSKASETEGEGGEEPTIIRAIPERRLGQVEGEPLARSRSWLDTVLGPSSSQLGLSRQTSSSSVATDADNPFDGSQATFRRTNSQPTLPINVPKRPDLTKSLPITQSEPALETVLAAYDMTPSRARTIHMTPSKNRLVATPSHNRLFGSPSKRSRMKEVEEVEEEVEDRPIAQGFEAWLSRQQTTILKILRNPPWAAIPRETPVEGSDERTYEVSVDGEKNETEAVTKLRALLRRTVETGEGNSCLLVGPRGCGKSRTVLRALRTLAQSSRLPSQARPSTPPPPSPTKPGGRKKQGKHAQQPTPSTFVAPIVIHLSGHAQTNDRLAMREIARQLVLQSGEALDVPLDEEDLDEGPTGVHVPTATHLPQIVGALARQIRPVIVVLDAFDLFAEHARQALLYCLLDTVQSCRAGQGSQGLAVVGVTSRIDCLTMLEKRVKSRFSHRIIRVSPPPTVDSYISLMISAISISGGPDKPRLPSTPKKNRKPTGTATQADSWFTTWRDSIDRIIMDRQFKQIIEDIFDLSRDVRLLLRILSAAVASLTPSSPWLTIGTISRSIQSQCSPLPFIFLQGLVVGLNLRIWS
ncbi:Origin recognition complex subunit 4 [Schizosaccharomyces pombe 972h-] [Rhizoctonia solani]|uniref:Origin recognition complex subunit 4 [Schizosaccharomyces pombe 972h-] n=1 Tax=Rhizoctonia solani TaxID=456999 RepID=A0A0K6GCF4_9AGAM|nr:Origin recognition complex subunit 4 [Schizosaccharomyces pombe 972h-] [Rhizoctonia solani]